jgi:mannitol/fructose-specific phosphotransferase system IIA component (Ntr-type)
VYEEVVARESIQTTGLGNGIAFPHARLEKCMDLAVGVGVSRRGIDFKSLDGRPCHIICLMISPAGRPYIILQMMAAFSRFFLKGGNAERLMMESSPEQIAAELKDSMKVEDRTVVARDIMRPVKRSVSMDTSIEQAAHIMHLARLDALPVVDDQNILRGKISCLNIFTYGIPDFFNQLQTVSFVKHLDPFEKYFKLRRDLKVKDLYEPNTNGISEDTTLMEMIFQMTARNRSELFVVNKGRLVGMIDRFSIIDRILFF